MTAKEKATWLTNMMLHNSCEPHPDDYAGDLYKVHVSKSRACALIAVDEILRIEGNYLIEISYWQQVKEEIEKL